MMDYDLQVEAKAKSTLSSPSSFWKVIIPSQRQRANEHSMLALSARDVQCSQVSEHIYLTYLLCKVLEDRVMKSESARYSFVAEHEGVTAVNSWESGVYLWPEQPHDRKTSVATKASLHSVSLNGEQKQFRNQPVS